MIDFYVKKVTDARIVRVMNDERFTCNPFNACEIPALKRVVTIISNGSRLERLEAEKLCTKLYSIGALMQA